MARNSRFSKGMNVVWFASLALLIAVLILPQVNWNDLSDEMPIWALPVVGGVFFIVTCYQLVRIFGGAPIYDIPSLIVPLSEDAGPLIQGPPVDSIVNFRGIGGLHTTNGGSLKDNLLFRSANWSSLSVSDLGVITDEIRMKTVVDFRSKTERAHRPDVSVVGVTNIHLPIKLVSGTGGALKFASIALCRRSALPKFMGNMLIDLLKQCPTEFGDFIRLVSDPDNLPITWHCSAGKDRASLATALVLAVAGVPEETIVAEYTLSNKEFPALMKLYSDSYPLKILGVPDDEMAPLLASNPEWLRGAFAFLHETYGGPVNYLLTVGGLRQSTLNKVRENLVDSPV